MTAHRFFRLGENALLLECASEISLSALGSVQHFYRILKAAPIQGVYDLIPAYTTLTLVFSLDELGFSSSPHTYLEEQVARRLEAHPFSGESSNALDTSSNLAPEAIVIPVCYDEEFAPDLNDIARHHNLSIDEVVGLHSGADYRVAMLGFTPGFPYLLGLHEFLHTPRKSVPRTRIEAGSVGIAGAQTGIYPLQSPGGWNIIGRTPLRLFTPEKEQITLLQSGDTVRFRAISAEEFREIVRSEESQATQQRSQTRMSALPRAERSASVLNAGIGATVQDAGRVGHGAAGISRCGAADALAAALANTLIGNARNDAVLEIPIGKLALQFEKEILIALTGDGIQATARLVEDSTNNTFPLLPMRPVLMRAGSILTLKHSRGLRAYCAFAGGVDVPLVLGSRSTDTKACLGGVEGRMLKTGDELVFGETLSESRTIAHAIERNGRIFPTHSEARFFLPFPNTAPRLSSSLRLTEGKEWSEFDDVSKNTLLTASFRVLPQSDRMGIRLQPTDAGVHLGRTSATNIISRAVLPGTLQCTPDGTLILLLADAQTTGGYPVIGHVCSVDVARAAQLLPNSIISFQQITHETAQMLCFEQEQFLREISSLLQWKYRYA